MKINIILIFSVIIPFMIGCIAGTFISEDTLLLGIMITGILSIVSGYLGSIITEKLESK